MDFDASAFRKGVNDTLTLRPLRSWVGWHFDRFVSWYSTKRLWGDRCSDFEPLCHTCQMWALHDDVFNGGSRHPSPERTAHE